MKNSIKAEIYKVIKNQLSREIQKPEASETSINYVNALNLYLTPFDVNEKNAFFKTFLPLIKKQTFPLLKVHDVIHLFNRWRSYPLIINDIKYLLSKLTILELNEKFWNQIIFFCGTKKDEIHIQKAKLSLIIRLINEKTLRYDQINNHPIFIKTLLNFQIKAIDINSLKNELNDRDLNIENMLCFHILKMSSEACEPADICNMIQLNFSPTKGELYNLHDVKSFFELMYKVLPSNYMGKLEYVDLGRLHKLYRINSKLFEETDLRSIQDCTFNNILDRIFKKFIVSGLFFNSFKYGRFTQLEWFWFEQVLNGKNIKDLPELPVKLTRKAAHVFRCLPSIEMNITQGIVLSSLQALVNDLNYSKRVIYAIRDMNYSNYWINAMAECYKNGLREQNVIQVMDYLNQKVLVEGRTVHLKNKRIFHLLNDIEDWHESLRYKKIKNERIKFPKTEIKKFSFQNTSENFEIIQILNPADLFHEGKILNHCVYSYRDDCERELCAMFSLRKINEGTSEPLITLELRKDLIVQARGFYNRLPLTLELEIIQSWAKENNLLYIA